jgi:hypothetical protein
LAHWPQVGLKERGINMSETTIFESSKFKVVDSEFNTVLLVEGREIVFEGDDETEFLKGLYLCRKGHPVDSYHSGNDYLSQF